MSYETDRDTEVANKLDLAIAGFKSRYLNNFTKKPRRTVFFFPGGMGSQLLRAGTPHSNGPPYSYNVVWLDCSILSGACDDLQMQGDIDFGQQFIIPDGPINFPPYPYAGFTLWCDLEGIDYLIFGWDWRRDLEFTANFFLDVFMPLFEQRVGNLSPNPLQHLTLVAHSFGGMLLKLILNRGPSNKYVGLLNSAGTVASPFYGYGGQLPRYFIGDPDLNRIYGNQTVTRIVSSLAAGYSLLFLDSGTYARDGQKLQQDPRYPLPNYPILDATTGVAVDPYIFPQTNGQKVRYPQNYGFSSQMLNRGQTVYNAVARLLDPKVSAKFFNIRGVQTRNGVDLNGTVTNQTWGWIDPDFDPNDVSHCPITDYLGPGDNTLPAWSTRFVHTPSTNVKTVRGATVDHTFMMINPKVLTLLESIV